MLLLKTSARGCIKSSSCWRLNDVKDFISVLACGVTQQLRLFGLWDFSKWRGSTCSSRNFSTGVFPLEVMRMSCCVRKAIWNAALIEFLCKSQWMKSSAFCQRMWGEVRKIFFFFFFFRVTKCCVVNSLTKSLFGFVLVLKPFLKTLSLNWWAIG